MTPAQIKAKELKDKYEPFADSTITPEIIADFETKKVKYSGSKIVALAKHAKQYNAKACAHIYVDGIIEILKTLHKPEYTTFIAKHLFDCGETEYSDSLHGYELIEYWQQVKQSI